MARRYFCPWFLLTLLVVWLAPIATLSLSASATPCTTARSCSTNNEENYLEPNSSNTPAHAIEVESVAQWQDEPNFEQPTPSRAIDIGQTTRLLTRLKLWLDRYDQFFPEEAAP
ncbi:hypothetical protein [Thermocoleostomius sinensis]|jgi:hypothetical protein|uniref:Uncharacterized protein n=1 Tax=Thermocoleostomius sinensis A174 TaxID=2016057 RepID=A0A9E8ZG44_9CYAN|nr:hypothetical protein [Thermocoleostomius sinensis]WAL61152.1 hypothetical protein OXH18_03885 [Thermocoleostomius sinensis A174]